MHHNLIDILVSTVTGLIMLGIGLSLRLIDFKNIFIAPKAIATALFSQMVALPIIAFIITMFAPISPEFKIGLIILAASPGGATSGFITYLLKGDIALSVSLTAVNSFLTLFSIPLVVNMALLFYLGESRTIHVPILDTLIHIFIITIIPVSIGIAIRHFKEKFAISIEKVLKFVMIFLLLVVFLIKFFAGKENGGVDFIRQDFYDILPYALLLNICCLLFGYTFLKLFKLSHKSSITASIESGVHNTSLALSIAATIIANAEMSKPILLYAMFSFITSLVIGYVLNYYFE